MAPSVVAVQPAPAPLVNPRKILQHSQPPTGKILTSGQHEPIYELLRSYSEFPKEITGPTVWKAEEYKNNPERWTHWWSDEEIAEIEAVSRKFLDEGRELVTINKDNFQLSERLINFLHSIKEDLTNGKGFILLKGFPVERWGTLLSAVAYMGIGLYLGNFVSQNRYGHLLGHVKDLGDDPSQIDKVRIYRTNARQFFHSDDSDIVGLLMLAKALKGGESDLVSSHHVFNTLQQRRPDIVETLTQPIWYFDRKGETSKGQKEWIRTSIFYFHDGRVYTKWDPYYVKSLTRFSDAGLIPPLSEKQLEAAQALEDTCLELALHMVLEVGDIQFVSNNHCLHARTEYVDAPPPAKRRELMRLWLAVPETEGGWRLPFHDSAHPRRGGVQVDETPESAPLDAE